MTFNLYFHLSICVLNDYRLSIYSVPVTVLGAGDTAVNKTDTIPVLMLEGEILNKGAEHFEKGEAMDAWTMCGKGSAPSLRSQGSSFPKE